MSLKELIPFYGSRAPVSLRRGGITLALATLLTACASHQPAESSIAQALAAPDDTRVVVTGALVQQTDREHLLLRDSTGQIAVVVDDDMLGKVKFAPDAQLRIYGEIDRDSQRSVLHAKSVQVVR